MYKSVFLVQFLIKNEKDYRMEKMADKNNLRLSKILK
jgi:hypothetical protein